MGFLKKVLKVVAVVAAVALAIPSGGTSLLVAGAASIGITLSAVAATALVAGLTIASSLLNKPKVPSVSNAALSRLSVSIDPRTPRKIVFGDTAMAADLRDYEYTGTDDEYVHYFIVNASHRITAQDEIWFDDKLAWTSAGGVQGEFVGYLTVATRTEGNAGNAINISPRMGLTRRFTGLAYTHLRFKRTGNTKKAESPFAQSIPQRVTTIGRGIPCYDPRLDSTVTGGSGSHRVDDQSTWAFTRNPALQLLTYLLGWRINDKLAVGKGMPVARLDLPSFMAAANACDEPVALAAGGTEPRYRADGIFSEADDMGLVIDAYKTTMNAELDDSDGKLAIRVLLNDLDDPIVDFGPDDFLSGLTWSPVADISDRFNVVRGQYTDARTTSLYQMIDYPEVLLASVDGIERSHNLPLPLVQSPSQAQRLAKQVLQRQQYSGTLEVTLGHTGWRVQKYDIVTITHPPLGFAAKLFRVASIGVGTHGQVQVTLREENAAIYAWDEDEKPPVTPAGVTSYNYTNNPLVQGIDEAGSLDLSAVPWSLVFTADNIGVIDAGQLPATVVFTAMLGTEDVTPLVTWPEAVVTNAAVTNNGDGTYTVTDLTAPTGSFTVAVTYGGITTERAVTLAKSRAGADAQRAEIPSLGTPTGAWANAGGTVTLNVTPDVAVSASMSANYGASTAGTVTIHARIMYRNVSDGGAWTQAGADIVGSAASNSGGSEPVIEPGSVGGTRSIPAPASTKVYEFQVEWFRDGAATIDMINSAFQVSIA
jgi:hypothetical protein